MTDLPEFISDRAFDAPRALARWRGAAVAACVLLAVGIGVLGRANVSFEEGPGPRPLADRVVTAARRSCR